MDLARIGQATIDGIIAHARREAPRECCGVLSGRGQDVLDATPTRNLSEDINRFLIDPQGHLGVLRGARAKGLDVVGFYHSHPRSDARASPTDIAEISYPGYLYLIIGLGSEPPDVRAFIPDAGVMTEVEVRIVG